MYVRSKIREFFRTTLHSDSEHKLLKSMYRKVSKPDDKNLSLQVWLFAPLYLQFFFIFLRSFCTKPEELAARNHFRGRVGDIKGIIQQKLTGVESDTNSKALLSATISKNILKICPFPILRDAKHFLAISWCYCLDLPGALHVGANIGWC